MPIYQGISTKNKAEIIINNQQMQKVYVGDRLVWQKPSGVCLPEYGLLYNWYADVRKISSSDDWVVPTIINFRTLIDYLGAGGDYINNTVGTITKETGTTYWTSANGTNTAGFNSRGNGFRENGGGTFSNLKNHSPMWSSTSANSTSAKAASTYDAHAYFRTTDSFLSKKYGYAVRLLYTGAGTPTSYTGNDGRVYRVVTIGTQTWLADNLMETKFRNGDVIPWHGATPASYFTNAEWAALTTPGVCAYGNILSNVAPGFTFAT